MERSKVIVSVALVVLAAATSPASARNPTPDEVRNLYAKLEQARVQLGKPGDPWGKGITAAEAADLRARVVAGEAAIKRFVDVAEQGRTRGKVMPVYAGAAGVILADDVSGVGVADDPLLVVIGAAALITLIATTAAAPADEIERAWSIAATAVSGAAALAQQIHARIRGRAEIIRAVGTAAGVAETTRQTMCKAKHKVDMDICRGLAALGCPEKFKKCDRDAEVRELHCRSGVAPPAFPWEMGCGGGR